MHTSTPLLSPTPFGLLFPFKNVLFPILFSFPHTLPLIHSSSKPPLLSIPSVSSANLLLLSPLISPPLPLAKVFRHPTLHNPLTFPRFSLLLHISYIFFSSFPPNTYLLSYHSLICISPLFACSLLFFK